MIRNDDPRDVFAVDADTVRQLLPTIFQRCGYDVPNIDDNARTAIARRVTQQRDYFGTSSRTQAELRWAPAPGPGPSTAVQWNVYEVSSGNRTAYPQKASELGESLRFAIGNWLAERTIRDAEAPDRDPVVGPGEPFERLFTGTLRDYSGCAREEDVAELAAGDLPLGRYAFGFDNPPQRLGAPLYLARFSNDGRMEYNGVLVCAPQNSGKTRLVIRWAKAATNARPH